MIFTDGQLLTATDINQFLLNRETNPDLHAAKTTALQRIEELKASIPSGGKPLEELPASFKADLVMQAWSLKYTRTKEEVAIGDYGKDVITIQSESISDFPQHFLIYDHVTMRIPKLEFYWGRNIGQDFIDLQDNTFKPLSYINDPQEKRFITFSKKKTKLTIDSYWKYFTNTSIEEVPDDLTKLLQSKGA